MKQSTKPRAASAKSATKIPDMIRIAVPGVSRDEVSKVAWDHDWVLEGMVGGNGQPVEKIWLTMDERSAIHFIEDHVLNVPYVAVEGEEKDAIAKKVRKALPALGTADLERLIKNAEDEDGWIEAIYQIAASTSGQHDSRLFALYERTLEHDEPEVRRAAVYAMAYPAWLEFRPVLERLAAEDESGDVREYARKMLADLKARYWSKAGSNAKGGEQRRTEETAKPAKRAASPKKAPAKAKKSPELKLKCPFCRYSFREARPQYTARTMADDMMAHIEHFHADRLAEISPKKLEALVEKTGR